MSISYTCSCGYSATFDLLAKGFERECAKCGRIIRVPLDGSTINLADAAAHDQAFGETLSLTKLTTNPRAGWDARQAIKRRLGWFVTAVIIGGALAFWAFGR